MILFQNILLLKEFIACNGCFGLFTKIKRGSGTNFWCTFCAWFFHQNDFYLILYQQRKFQCHTSFPRCQTKWVIKFLFSQLMMSQTIRLMLDQPLKQSLIEKKRGKDGNTKIWISRERKKLFGWNKKHFS